MFECFDAIMEKIMQMKKVAKSLGDA